MSVESRVRALVQELGGRAPVERVVREAMGLAGAPPPLARRLVESALREMRGFALEGGDVVERAAPRATRWAALALAPTASPTALPAVAAWLPLPQAGEPVTVSLAGEAWRAGVASLARDLAGKEVLALSAAGARRVLRLGALVAGLEAEREPDVVALGPIARALGRPLRTADDAAALVGGAVPETPEDAARLLARLCEALAELGRTDVAGLRALGESEPAAEFDFGERAFARDDLRALPDAPGVYVFEDAEGDVAYVGKAQSLRRRVASYFVPVADERAGRVRDAAHALSVERTGSELTALLREQQLIRELRPALNVQASVHARGRAPSGATGARVAVVQPSAEGGAEIVLLDRERGAASLDVVLSAERRELERAVLGVLDELASRERAGEGAADVEVALTWLAERGAQASVVEIPAEDDAAVDLLLRLADDPDLKHGRIVPVR